MGASVARRFIREGAKVVLGGRDGPGIAAIAAGIGATGVVCDLLDEAALGQGVASAKALMGGIDIAVNLAGANRSSLIADETAEGLTAQAMLHFVGTTLFIRDTAAAMDGGGAIITISSLTVELTGTRLAAYAASKAAADKVVQIAALEYGERGIRVNAIAPGLTRTAMTASYFENPAILSAFQRETPTGRMAVPEDVAAAAVWLASDECGATGDLVRVSGGMHLRRLPTARDFTL
jgi:NAD(P)-dependent dehydrogenase (short-subunit alcohol dehydrogenase family)